MFGKKQMTPAEAEAALRAEAAKNARERERRATYVTCGAGHIQYAGERGCRQTGCRG